MLSDTELVTKYGQFCGYMAWVLVRNSLASLRYADQVSSTLGTEDAEDFASQALIALVKIPQAHRHEPPYIKRSIINAILKARKKRLKTLSTEWQAPQHTDTEQGSDWFDTLEGRDGLAGHTQVKYDSRKVLEMLPQLPQCERIVLELSFGIGCEPLGLERIARKLGRTKYWADARLQRGLNRVRESLHLGSDQWVGESLKMNSLDSARESASM